MSRTGVRTPWDERPGIGTAALAAVVLVCGLAGLVAGGEWRWLAVPACLFLGFTILWSVRGWRRSALRLGETERHLLDLVDFPTQSPFLSAADGRALYTGARWQDWTGMDSRSVADGRWLDAVHETERKGVEEAWADALAKGTPYDREFRVRFQDGQYRWLRARAYPSHDSAGKLTHWAGILENIHDRKTTETLLRQTATMLEMIGSSTESIIYAKDREGRMLYGNRALEDLTGLGIADILGKTDAEWHGNRAEAETLQEADRKVLATGYTQTLEECFTGRDGVRRHYQSIKSPLRDGTGAVIGVVGVSTDVSSAMEAEQREKLLSRELDHRAKNLLAVVQSVVSLTRADTLSEFKLAVEGRIQSLGRAHSMLAASRWEGADLQRVLREELAPYGGSDPVKVSLSGPPLLLRPAAAQSLALVIHELATNAVKYGALSCAPGRLRVSWEIRGQIEGEPLLRLHWEESGGPPVPPRTGNSRTGFGSRLIRNSIERQLGGKLEVEWAESGVVAKMELALDRSIQAGADVIVSSSPGAAT